MSINLGGALSNAFPFSRDYTSENEINDYQIVPHIGDTEEIYHAHSLYSDGKNTFDKMFGEAVRLDLDHYGIFDHLDLTGISRQVHQGPWMGNFSDNMEYRREAFDEFLEDADSDVAEDEAVTIGVARGAEIDWDPSNVGKLLENISELDMDYQGISVHYLEDGMSVKSPQLLQDSIIDEKVDEYVNETLNAIEVAEEAGFDVVCHPGRAEEGLLDEGITAETYYPIIAAAAENDLLYELNTKVHLRYLLNNHTIPSQLETSDDYITELPSEFEALATFPGELPNISVGTDTHRVGHSESKRKYYTAMRDLNFPEIGRDFITESQMRLRFAEEIFNQLSNIRGDDVVPTSLLEDVETTDVRFNRTAFH